MQAELIREIQRLEMDGPDLRDLLIHLRDEAEDQRLERRVDEITCSLSIFRCWDVPGCIAADAIYDHYPAVADIVLLYLRAMTGKLP